MRAMGMGFVLPLAIGLAVTSGCASTPATAAENARATTGEDALPAPDRRAVERARRALQDAGFATQALRLDSVEARDWPDSSLGCPQPGMPYLQVITPGYQVRFSGPTETYDVRVSGDGALVCRPGMQLLPGAPKESRQPVRNLDLRLEEARAALATRLGVPTSRVLTHDIVPVRLPPGPLGCGLLHDGGAENGRAGFQLVLAAAGEIYTYHTDLESVTPCPPVANE